jgi:hypothetical protein
MDVAADTASAAATAGGDRLPLECRGKTVGALVGLDKVPASREPRFAPATQAAPARALEPGAIALDNA